MAQLCWSDTLLTGVESIDREHKDLVALANDLDAALVARQSGEQINAVLMKLYKYATVHFGNEERLMRAIEYPDFSIHRSEHAKFLNKLDELSYRVQANIAQIAKIILDFLTVWLQDHISKTDVLLGRYMTENNIDDPRPAGK
jgi:hemerythrin-like metal-binding protein